MRPRALGRWWHKVGEDFDLCTAEYDKLDDAEKKLFIEVQDVDDLAEVPTPTDVPLWACSCAAAFNVDARARIWKIIWTTKTPTKRTWRIWTPRSC